MQENIGIMNIYICAITVCFIQLTLGRKTLANCLPGFSDEMDHEHFIRVVQEKLHVQHWHFIKDNVIHIVDMFND